LADAEIFPPRQIGEQLLPALAGVGLGQIGQRTIDREPADVDANHGGEQG
jgi:hypothetical protein